MCGRLGLGLDMLCVERDMRTLTLLLYSISVALNGFRQLTAELLVYT